MGKKIVTVIWQGGGCIQSKSKNGTLKSLIEEHARLDFSDFLSIRVWWTTFLESLFYTFLENRLQNKWSSFCPSRSQHQPKQNISFKLFLQVSSPQSCFPICIMIVLMNKILETSRNQLKKHFVSFQCSNKLF